MIYKAGKKATVNANFFTQKTVIDHVENGTYEEGNAYKKDYKLVIFLPLVEKGKNGPWHPEVTLEGKWGSNGSIGSMFIITQQFFDKFGVLYDFDSDNISPIPQDILDQFKGKEIEILKYRSTKEDGSVFHRNMNNLVANPKASYSKKNSYGDWEKMTSKEWLIMKFNEKVNSAYPPYMYKPDVEKSMEQVKNDVIKAFPNAVPAQPVQSNLF